MPLWIWVLACILHLPVVLFVGSAIWQRAITLDVETLRRADTFVLHTTVPYYREAPKSTRERSQRVASPVVPPVRIPEPISPRVKEPAPDPTAPVRGLPIPDLPIPVVSGGQIVIPSAVAPPAVSGITRIAPTYGTGVLWGKEPPPPAVGQLAERVLGLSAGAKIDSNITALVQRYVDSMAADFAANKPASWTTGVGNKKLGVDAKWIYLGPIKIPTAILALLPINIQSNPTAAEFNKRLNVMREDIFEAARRAQNYHDFRNAVDELRAEKQAERDFRTNQRTPPTGGGNQH